VISESVSDQQEILYLGMRFPAEDIPKAARELYMNSTLRVMADVDAEPVPLIPPVLPSGKPLNQGTSVLRAMSTMHVQYLKNMGIKASLSIALISDNQLWGLMAFHHYTPKIPPNHLVSEMKASCELFTDIVISYLNPAVDLDQVKYTFDKKTQIEQVLKYKELGDRWGDKFQEITRSLLSVLPYDYIGIINGTQTYLSTNKAPWTDTESLPEKLNTLILSQGDKNTYRCNTLLAPDNQIVLSKEAEVAGILAMKSNKLDNLIVFFANQ